MWPGSQTSAVRSLTSVATSKDAPGLVYFPRHGIQTSILLFSPRVGAQLGSHTSGWEGIL